MEIVKTDKEPQIATSDKIVVNPKNKTSFLSFKKEKPLESADMIPFSFGDTFDDLNGANPMKIAEIMYASAFIHNAKIGL